MVYLLGELIYNTTNKNMRKTKEKMWAKIMNSAPYQQLKDYQYLPYARLDQEINLPISFRVMETTK